MWIKFRMGVNPSGMPFNDASEPQANTENISSLPGLDGIHAPLLYLHKEVGLVGKLWTSLGDRWQVLCKLWLHAEAILESSTCSDLSFTQIHKSAIPEDWKDWMNSKLMNSNAKAPADTFGNVFTKLTILINLTNLVMSIGILFNSLCGMISGTA